MTEKDAIAVLVAVGNHVDGLLAKSEQKDKLQAALRVLDGPPKRAKRSSTVRTNPPAKPAPAPPPTYPQLRPIRNALQSAALAARERQRATN
jgi:hypothetical protein